MANGDGTDILDLNPALPGGPQPTPAMINDIAASAATPTPLGPVLQRNRFALTKPPGNYQQVPSFTQTDADVQAGVPGSAAPLTKLGKLLTILHGAGMGAMVGSTQPTFGTGAMASQQFENQQVATQQAQEAGRQQQQQRELAIEQARQNLAQMPWQIARARQMSDLELQQHQAALHGIHTTQTYRDDNNELMQRDVDIFGNQVGQARRYAPKNPSTLDKFVFDPQDTEGIARGYPTMPPISAGYDKTLNEYRTQNGDVIPNAHEVPASIWSRVVSSQMPQRIPAEISAQLGPKPSTTQTPSVYKGKTFASAADADAQWGRDFQGLRTRTSNTWQWVQDANGEWRAMPKTTVSRQGTGGGAGRTVAPAAAPAAGGAGAAPAAPGVPHSGVYGHGATKLMTGTMPDGKTEVAGSAKELSDAGVKNPTEMAGPMKQTVQSARELTSNGGLFDLVDQDLKRFKPEELDGIGNRLNDLEKGTPIGADDRYVRLSTHVNGLLDSALMQAHGVRGQRIMEKFHKLADAGTFTYSNLKTALDSERDYVEGRAMRVPQKQAPTTGGAFNWNNFQEVK